MAAPPALLAIAPSPFVTLQDTGRFGWQRFGVSRSGAMDPEALAIANALLDNPPQTAALEFAHAGGRFEVAATSCRIAVTGGRFAAFVDEAPLPAFTTATLTRGQTLRIGGSSDAVWGYLAVQGGFAVPPQLGSLSTHARSGIGGYAGRAVRAGDVLPLAMDWVRAQPERSVRLAMAEDHATIRVTLGPQDDYFTPAAIATFRGSEFTVSNRMDRLGCWLDGPALAHARGYNIISDGIVPGCIQVPGSGSPVVLLRDAQPPGGYPKIATVITSDLGGLAQSRPGRRVRFAVVSVAQSHEIRRAAMQRMAAVRAAISDVQRGQRTGLHRSLPLSSM